VVIPGLYQDPSVAALALAINNALGNVGKTVFGPSEPVIPLPSDQLGDFKALVADLNAGKVDWLVILNANPIYDAPADLNFADAFNKAKTLRISARTGRDGADCALAHSRGALSGVVVGCARLRRHGFDCAADDRSALWRQDGARCFADAAERADAERVRSGARDVEAGDQGRL
jgi:hypothetical protein